MLANSSLCLDGVDGGAVIKFSAYDAITVMMACALAHRVRRPPELLLLRRAPHIVFQQYREFSS
jgi:hypothetical protein